MLLLRCTCHETLAAAAVAAVAAAAGAITYDNHQM
jgi:hypothetical protein